MSQLLAPLVGMRFRPPALTILQGLGIDQELVLKREPANAFDENAIAVYLPQNWNETLPELWEEAIVEGESLALELDAQNTHLGYIARERAAHWAPLLDQGASTEAVLTFSSSGSPMVAWERQRLRLRRKQMRSILVDPYLEQISEIEYDGQWQSIGRLLGIAESPFTMIRLGDVEDHHMYLDDEGLYKPQQRFFILLGAAAPLAGRGLILRETGDGDEAPATVPLGVVRNSIKFLPKSVRYSGSTTREGVINHPTFGRTTVIENTPHFIDTKRMN